MGVYVMAKPEPRAGRRVNVGKRLMTKDRWSTARSLRIAFAAVAGAALAAFIVGAAALA